MQTLLSLDGGFDIFQEVIGWSKRFKLIDEFPIMSEVGESKGLMVMLFHRITGSHLYAIAQLELNPVADSVQCDKINPARHPKFMKIIFWLTNIGLLAVSFLVTVSAVSSQAVEEKQSSPDSQLASELDEIEYFEGSWRCEQPPNSLSPESTVLDWQVERDLNGAWYFGYAEEVATATNPEPINSQEFLGYDAVSNHFVRVSAVSNGNLLNMASLGWQDEQFVWKGTVTTRSELISLRQIITREDENTFTAAYFVLDAASDEWQFAVSETCERQVSLAQPIAITKLEYNWATLFLNSKISIELRAIDLITWLPSQEQVMAIARTYVQEDFPPILKCQALAFMRVEWPYIFEGAERFLSETYPPKFDPTHFVIVEGETLMSYAAVVRTNFMHAGEEFRVYGFGNMFTFPPYRGEDHGHKLLDMATDTIEKSDADVGVLYCNERLETFYASKGWIMTKSPTRFGSPEEYEDSEEQRMMLFVSEKGRRNRNTFDEQPLYVNWTW